MKKSTFPILIIIGYVIFCLFHYNVFTSTEDILPKDFNDIPNSMFSIKSISYYKDPFFSGGYIVIIETGKIKNDSGMVIASMQDYENTKFKYSATQLDITILKVLGATEQTKIPWYGSGLIIGSLILTSIYFAKHKKSA